MNTATTPTAVLVHGAFADASGFAGIVRELYRSGLPGDRARQPASWHRERRGHVRAAAAAVDGPVVLVGHSYGGA